MVQRHLIQLLAALLWFAPLFSGDRTFRADRDHTRLGFKAATLLFDVPGKFTRYTVELSGDPDSLEGARALVQLETASIDTQNGKRDAHLRTADFFDATRFPKITFTSTRIWRDGGVLNVAGVLDLHGIRRELLIPFEANKGETGGGTTYAYKGTLRIKRADFALGEGIAASLSLKDEVELNLLLVGFFDEKKTDAPKAPAKKR